MHVTHSDKGGGRQKLSRNETVALQVSISKRTETKREECKNRPKWTEKYATTRGKIKADPSLSLRENVSKAEDIHSQVAN